MSGPQLGNFRNAYVADAKVRDYLLAASHPNNGGKAGFFRQFGFSQQMWIVLQEALRMHPRTNPVIGVTTNQYGVKYKIRCSLSSPDRRNPCINTVWLVDPQNGAPQLVTAFP
jgi:hypothetical protein